MSETDASGRLLTTAEVAHRLNVNRMTVVRYVEAKLLPCVYLPPSVKGGNRGSRRFRQEDVEAFIAASTKAAS